MPTTNERNQRNTRVYKAAILDPFLRGFKVLNGGWSPSRSRSRSRSHKSASNLVKIENRSRKQSHKLDKIGVGRIRTVHMRIISVRVISGIGGKWNRPDSAYNSDFRFSLGRKGLRLRLRLGVASANQPLFIHVKLI